MNGVITLRRLAFAASAGIAIVCVFRIAQLVVLDRFFTEQQMVLVTSLLTLVAGVLFLWWLGRARRNLLEFRGEERRFTPGWTIGAWFIPIANIILPGLVTADIANGSSTEPDTRRRLVGLTWSWWACYMLNSVFAYGAAFAPEFESALSLVGDAVYLAAGVLAIVLMFQLTAAQRTRFEAVEHQPNPADFPTFTVDELRPAD